MIAFKIMSLTLSYSLMIAAGGRWAVLAALLSGQHPQMANEADFNSLCRQIISEGRRVVAPAAAGDRFAEMLAKTLPTEPNKRIPTAWGGVYVVSYDTNSKVYDKYLVVRGGQYLSFEKHNEKTENLEVEEGTGVLLFRDRASGKIAVRGFEKGARVTLNPGDEHCLIALSDMVVHERGVEPLGMDNDLVFIFRPAAAK